MIQDIFVGVLIVAVVAAGVWCWWVENGRTDRKEKTEDVKSREGKCVNEKN